MRTPQSTAREGSILMATLFALAIVAGMSGLVFFVTSTNLRSTKRFVDRAAAVSYADGILENLFDQWRQQMISAAAVLDRRDGMTSQQLAGLLTNPSTSLPAPQGITLDSWGVFAADPWLNAMPLPTDRPAPESGSVSSMRKRLYYIGRATVKYTGPSGSNTVTLERSFSRGGRNLFDDFLFSTQKITEIHPGAPMYIDRSQINGDVYMAHQDLHLLSDFTYTGSLTLNYRTNDSRFGDAPTITNGGLADNWSLDNPPRQGPEQKLLDTRADQLESVFLDDPTSNDLSADGNTNNDGYREIIEESNSSGTDPLRVDNTPVNLGGISERFADNADYRISVDANNNVKVYKGSDTAALAASDPAYIALVASLTTNTAIKDTRENDNVRLINLNVSSVKAGVDAGKITDVVGGDGILLYVTDTSAGSSVSTKLAGTTVTSSRQRGVRLINGAKLPQTVNPDGSKGGFTVVSPNPVYIQGDYNTGTTTTTKPASNTATQYTPPNDTPNPVVPGYDKVPAAVAGDSVNILSNSWVDANSTLAKTSRVASNTTVNAAVIAGNVPTTTSSYSGGIENFVRFHESWSNRYFTIYGALALLYASKYGTGNWTAATYDPPNRRWFYDTLFRENNPPGIKTARSYDRGRWTIR